VVNADDFGFTRDVNAGIIEAYERGILTATTLMAEGEAFEDAVRLAGEHPGLDIGVHLTLVGMPGLPASLAGCTTAVYSGQLDVYEIFAAQVRKVLAAGIRPTHVDTHKHTHLLPPVLRAVCTVAEEFGIGWVRSPGDFPFSYGRKGLVSRVMRWRRRGHAPDDCGGGATDDGRLYGVCVDGNVHGEGLGAAAAGAAGGVTELMCHPGRLGGEFGRRQHQAEGEPGAGVAGADASGDAGGGGGGGDSAGWVSGVIRA
jgi:hypothetical protein